MKTRTLDEIMANRPLDMADKYPPAEAFEERDTLPPSDWEEDTLPSMRNPLLPQEEKRYPGVGLMIALVTGVLFWGAVFYMACR